MPFQRSRVVLADGQAWIDADGNTGSLPVAGVRVSAYSGLVNGPRVTYRERSTTAPEKRRSDKSTLDLLTSMSFPSGVTRLNPIGCCTDALGDWYIREFTGPNPTNTLWHYDESTDTWTSLGFLVGVSLDMNRAGYATFASTTGRFRNLSTNVETVWTPPSGSVVGTLWNGTYMLALVRTATFANEGLYRVDTTGTTVDGPHTFGYTISSSARVSSLARDQNNGYWMSIETSSSTAEVFRFNSSTMAITHGPFSYSSADPQIYGGPQLYATATDPPTGRLWTANSVIGAGAALT